MTALQVLQVRTCRREEFSLSRPSFSFLQGERHQPLYFQRNIYATRYPDGPQPTLSLQSIQPPHSPLESKRGPPGWDRIGAPVLRLW